MKISLVQFRLEDSKQANLEKALRMIEQASGSDLIVLPEMLMGRKTADIGLPQLAEDVYSGDFACALRMAAVQAGACVCACLWEDTGTDKVYNTAVVYDAGGGMLAKYRKLHLFDALSVKESDTMISGDELPPVFECGGVMCGLSICYDLRFPELYRSLVRGGAEVLLVPAAWYAGERKVEHLHTLLSARALENTSYACCADLCGGDFAGYSAVFAPFGEAVGRLETEEGILSFEPDMDYLRRVRQILPCLDNYRRDVLG
jgi:predicted amidohydrolase